jgi:methylenetetrahydrofolate reductase (NADPH)
MSAFEPSTRSPIGDILTHAKAAGRRTLSFEFYPYRDAESAAGLWKAFDDVTGAGADFVSLTYGAGGSSQARSFEVLERMAPKIATIGHLTAVGATRNGVAETIRRFEDLGVASVLALRGDNPKNDPDAMARSEVTTALELLEVVAEVSRLEAGVAAFPEKHPEAPSLEHDAQLLERKQSAGAKYAITQLFFHVDDYTSLVQRAADHGVDFAILPGLMPISNAKQVLRMAELSGAKVPADFLAELESLDDAAAAVAGMRFSVQLAQELLAAGAPGIHLFTLNRSESSLQIASEAGLL